MRLVATITVWHRLELARLAVEHWATVMAECFEREGIDLQLVVVGSEGEESKAITEGVAGVTYVEHENQPLSNKVNAGIQQALALGADGVIPCGSDEFLTPSLICSYAEMIENGIDYMGLTDRLVMRIAPGEPGLWHMRGYHENHPRYGEPMGGARCFSARLLKFWGGVAYGPVPRGLDATVTAKLRSTPHAAYIASMDDFLPGSAYLDVRVGFGITHPPENMPSQYQKTSMAQAERVFSRDELRSLDDLREKLIVTVDALILVRGDRGEDLKRALTSLKDQGVTKTIVRVDTRRGREAVEVAKQMGCDVIDTTPVPIYGDPKNSIHFSAVRNEMLAMAKSEFVFWLDSDEEVKTGIMTIADEAARAKALGADAVDYKVLCQHEDGRGESAYQIRIHRTSARFELPAHNVLTGKMKVARTEAKILSRYDDHSGRDERTPPMLHKLYEEGDPDSRFTMERQRAHAAYYLCKHYFGNENFTESLKWGLICRDLFPDSKGKADFWVCLAFSAYEVRGAAAGVEVVEEAMLRHSQYQDILWLRAAFDVYRAVRMSQYETYPSTPSGAQSQFKNAESIFKSLGIPLRLNG